MFYMRIKKTKTIAARYPRGKQVVSVFVEIPSPLWDWVCKYASLYTLSKRHVLIAALEAYKYKREKA
jgi:hypothetical protein